MNKLPIILIALLSLGIVFTSCKEEKKEEIIIVNDSAQQEPEQPQGPIARDSITESKVVTWGENKYTVLVTRKPDMTLGTIKHEETGEEYIDNVVTIKVLRDDNSEAISRRYTKDTFKEHVPSKQFAGFSLLNIMHEEDSIVNGKLNFTVAVGDPDDDDCVTLLQMLMSKTGDVTIKQLIIDEKTGEEADLEP